MKELKSIIIVDDHEMIRANIAEFLADHFNEAKVIVVSTGREFLKQFVEEHPVLAIVDIVLLDICGIDAVKKLNFSREEQKIIFISNMSDDLILYKCYLAGGNAFIHKFLSIQSMLKAIKTIFSNHLFYPKEIWKEAQKLEKFKNKLIGFEFDIIESMLTRTEMKIFVMLGQRESKTDLLNQLQISAKTLEKHLSSIRHKLELNSTNEIYSLSASYYGFKRQVRQI